MVSFLGWLYQNTKSFEYRPRLCASRSCYNGLMKIPRSIESDFPRLIRDKIPTRHKKKTGKQLRARVAKSDKEYLTFLTKKLVEESLEAQVAVENNDVDQELAALFEVIDAILVLKHWTPKYIKSIQKKKRETYGGFRRRLLMLGKDSK